MTLKRLIASALVALGLTVPATAAPLVVGGKNFTEQHLIAEITAQLLTARGFQVDKRAGLGTAPLRQALEDGQVDTGQVFATDGRIPAFDFVVLKDDKGYFPNYAMTPVVRQQVLDANPTLGEVLNDLSGRLDDANMTALNSQVDVDKKSVEAVATDFLKAQGLL